MIPMDVGTWRCQFSSGVALEAEPPGWMFAFSPDGHVNYVVAHGLRNISAAASITISGSIDGPGPFTQVDPDDTPPATFSLYFQRNGDTGNAPNYRWWSKDRRTVTASTFVFTVPLQPVLWSNVFGKSGDSKPAHWRAALGHCINIGLTFSGSSFGGHGVKGTGTFHCQSYTVD